MSHLPWVRGLEILEDIIRLTPILNSSFKNGYPNDFEIKYNVNQYSEQYRNKHIKNDTNNNIDTTTRTTTTTTSTGRGNCNNNSNQNN